MPNTAEINTAVFLPYFSMTLRERELEKSLLVISEILGRSVNTLTDVDKYSICNRENIQQSTQMQLSHKEKTLSDFFASFLKSTLNF